MIIEVFDRKDTLGRSSFCVWKGNIEIYFRQIGWETGLQNNETLGFIKFREFLE